MGLAFGVARVPHHGNLSADRHEQPEVYLVLDGTGAETIDGVSSRVRRGPSVFIPGGASHLACLRGALLGRVAAPPVPRSVGERCNSGESSSGGQL
jgi:quercetin dioxygenase-like cupin family protein